MPQKNAVNFDNQLLTLMKSTANKELLLSLIDKNIINAYDGFGNLLHYAALYGNAKITEHLIKEGCDINHVGQDGNTALMIAVLFAKHNDRETLNCIRSLLESNARLDLINADGKTALQMNFNCEPIRHDILQLFLNKIRSTCSDDADEELVSKFIKAGYNLCHATYMCDYSLIDSMLKYGVDINARGPKNKTALLVALMYEDLYTIDCLLEKGADLNAQDEAGNSVLAFAAYRGNKNLLQLFLEKGANPNLNTNLLFAVVSPGPDNENTTECIKLLLQYGAILHNPLDSQDTILDCALKNTNMVNARLLVAQVALFEKMGIVIEESVMTCNNPKNQTESIRLIEYHEDCKQVLETVMFESLSMSDLLVKSKRSMIKQLRKKTFVSKIKDVCLKEQLSNNYPYYYDMLMKCVDEAAEIVKLLDIGIPIVCRFLDKEKEYHIPAEKIVDYLSMCDLERLTLV